MSDTNGITDEEMSIANKASDYVEGRRLCERFAKDHGFTFNADGTGGYVSFDVTAEPRTSRISPLLIQVKDGDVHAAIIELAAWVRETEKANRTE